MKDIRAYFNVNENIACSGQPTEEQFSAIVNNGYSVVVNLAMPTSDFAIANEGEVVSSLGMSYVHIPVKWEAPQLSDLQSFFAVMQAFKEKKIWVHCALNMRASCFIYLYRKHVLQIPESEALYPMREIWQPSGEWQHLVSLAEKIK
jgi:protein tyrosine phosphatase (PTP) superfamily phosphohydrolase (DUF442 family)